MIRSLSFQTECVCIGFPYSVGSWNPSVVRKKKMKCSGVKLFWLPFTYLWRKGYKASCPDTTYLLLAVKWVFSSSPAWLPVLSGMNRCVKGSTGKLGQSFNKSWYLLLFLHFLYSQALSSYFASSEKHIPLASFWPAVFIFFSHQFFVCFIDFGRPAESPCTKSFQMPPLPIDVSAWEYHTVKESTRAKRLQTRG